MPRRWLLAALAISWFLPAARALDPNRTISQYIRDQWRIEQGFPGGGVNAITEGADGYLWIGAEKGLVRFDGLNFVLFGQANSSQLLSGSVLGLNADSKGELWIRLESPGLLRYRDGTFQSVFSNLTAELGVTAMGRGYRGDILLARAGAPLRYSNGKFEDLAAHGESTRRLVISVAETAGGRVWMGTRDAGLFSLQNGREFVPAGQSDRKINCLLPGDGEELWVGTDAGLVRWNGSELTRSGVPQSLRRVQVLALTRDRDSNIWAGTAGGLMRIDAHGVASADSSGRQLGAVSAIFEDREGDLWVGGTKGIERYRDSTFLTYSAPTADSSQDAGPLYVDASGRTWFGPSGGGLGWLKGAEKGSVADAGLGKDVVYSIDGGRGEVWIGRQRGGLTRLRDQGGSLAAETYTAASGLAPGSVYAVHRNRDGTVWAGTLGDGLSRIRGGRITTFTTSDGLASNTISAIEEGAGGAMWFATPNGLNEFAQNHWRLYTSQEGLPPGRINCLTLDSAGILWIGTSAGLAFLRDGRVRTPREPPESLLDEVLGISDDGRGSLWIATARHVVRASRDHLLSNRPSANDVREFTSADGIPAPEGVRRHRTVVLDASGRVWFSLQQGISVVDPSRQASQSVPAIVHIQSVAADGRQLDTRSPLKIPTSRQRITFGFIGLSLSVPERVRFRYRLDGFDHDWSAPVAAHDTAYTNLSPGPYRFHVIACNSEGIWNSAEATVAVEMTPMVWQTLRFRLAVVGACILGVLSVYRFRLHQLTRQLNLRFEERLAERTRIAQDLHDTLLQGLLSASMQLHVAVESVPADLPAKPQLKRVLQLMQQVVGEGRNAVRGLRASGAGADDLEDALSRLRAEHAISGSAEFRVIVEGKSRPLNPFIRDEVYRIGREALINAFRHSGAARVEVELDYAADQLRLVVRDSGSGIDPEVLRSGREGHWGLPGMRERAERIGARFKVWSRAAAGTEVELTVPGDIAFPRSGAKNSRKWPLLRRQRIAREDIPIPTREQKQ